MKILALDVATNTGWAVYDTDRHESAITCGTLSLSKAIPKGSKVTDRRHIATAALDEALCRLVAAYRPDYAIVELPLGRIESHTRKSKGMFADHDDGNQSGGPNADTVLMLNQLFATATCVIRHKVSGFETVSPRTWQVAITKGLPGSSTKDRSMAFVSAIGVQYPPTLNKKDKEDAADAVCLAVWCYRNSQHLKILQAAREDSAGKMMRSNNVEA